MLEDSKKLYQQSADMIPNWRELSKSELCNLYLEHEHESAGDSYLSAIILSYWHSIDKLYSQSYVVASPEDCYDWLIHAVQYALRKRSWTDPKNKIYGDPNGPDKIINRCIKSTRLTYYQSINRIKRKVNNLIYSLEQLQEDSQVEMDLGMACEDSYDDSEIYNNLVRMRYDRKEYFQAFLIDIILYGDVFIYNSASNQYDYKESNVLRYLKMLDSSYCVDFSNKYGYNIEHVKKAASYVNCLSASKIKTKLSDTIIEFKHSEWFTSCLLGDRNAD